MFCGKCGSQCGGGEFCAYCGNRLQIHHKKKSIWPFLIKCLAVVLAAVGIVGFGYYSLHSTLSQTINDHFSAIRKGNITEAYYNYTAKELQKVISLDSFRELVTTTPVFIDNQSVKVIDSTLDYPYGVVDFHLISQNEDEVAGEYKLYREGGKWKIYDILIALPEEQLYTIPVTASVGKWNKSDELSDNTQISTTTTVPIEEPGNSPAIAPIANQLDALKLENFDKAYHTYLSREYTTKHSFEEFKEFISHYPILTKFKTASFKEVKVEEDHGTVVVILDPNAGAIPITYTLVKENNEWLINNIVVNLEKSAEENPQQLNVIVQKFLQDIKQGESVKAYKDFTSSKFQEITPYNVLQEFITNFSVLTEYQSLNFAEPKIHEGVGNVNVTLSNQRHKMELLFTLGVENQAWKIWGVKLIKNEGIAEESGKQNLLLEAHTTSQPQVTPIQESGDIGKRPFSSSDLDAVIQAQLNDLSNQLIKEAYEKYSSSEFKKSTPLDVFGDFIEKYPVFERHKSTIFDKLVFNNNIPTFSGTIIGKDGKEFKVEYDFIKENDAWKILHIVIVPKEATEKERRTGVNNDSKKPLEFVKALIGNTVDKSGIVQDPKTVFKTDSGNVYVNLYIQNGVKGTRIEMGFKHLDSGSSIPPISTTLQDDGSAIISYDFTNPSRGWPRGQYSMLVTSSTGQNKEFLIRIE